MPGRRFPAVYERSREPGCTVLSDPAGPERTPPNGALADQRPCLETLFAFLGISTEPAHTIAPQWKNRYRVSVGESKAKKPVDYPPMAPKTRTAWWSTSDWTTTGCQPGSDVISPSGTSPEAELPFTTLRLSARESARRAGRPAPR